MKNFFFAIMFACIGLFSTQSLANNSVLFVLTNHGELGDTGRQTGFWLGELTHPYYIIKDASYNIDIASIDGGKAPIDPRSDSRFDKDNRRFYNDEELQAAVENTLKLSDLSPDDYSAILFVGGHGTMWDFPDNDYVNKFTASIYENNGVVAAVCHGPAALTYVKLDNGEYLISGKQFAAFTNDEESSLGLSGVMPFLLQDKLEKKGGIHVHARNWAENAIVDNRVVTGQNPASAHKVGELVVAELSKLGITP